MRETRKRRERNREKQREREGKIKKTKVDKGVRTDKVGQTHCYKLAENECVFRSSKT